MNRRKSFHSRVNLDNKEYIFLLGQVKKKNRIFSWLNPEYYLTASILTLKNYKYENVMFDTINQKSHVLIENSKTAFNFSEILIDDFDGDNINEIAIYTAHDENKIIVLDFQIVNRNNTKITAYKLYKSTININKLSKFECGDIDGDGKAEIAYLYKDNNLNYNVIRFIEWAKQENIWVIAMDDFNIDIRNNNVVGLEVDSFMSDGKYQIAALLEKPDRNIFRVYEYQNNEFMYKGLF